ncbi:hypothetical protein [Vibrio sp. B183]|uniref:hypothetical protein n=1 Tax=Vibrio sp. B183 TaxID=1526762 RepID=UPI001267A8E2|nr:hypothetical protein [Vibrio sp. B183]
MPYLGHPRLLWPLPLRLSSQALNATGGGGTPQQGVIAIEPQCTLCGCRWKYRLTHPAIVHLSISCPNCFSEDTVVVSTLRKAQ